MNAVVLFESMFGNTETIARAVAEGLSAKLKVDVMRIDGTPVDVSEADLLVFGGPTHAFGMSRLNTRQAAQRQGAPDADPKSTGLREALQRLPPGSSTPVAVFDTRVNKPRLPGSAAHGAMKRLRKLGYKAVSKPKSFHVDGTSGPLIAGEENRARE